MHLGDEKMDGRDLKSEEFVRLEAELMIQFRTSAKPYEKSIAISYLVLQLKKNRITLDIERSVRELCSVIVYTRRINLSIVSGKNFWFFITILMFVQNTL